MPQDYYKNKNELLMALGELIDRYEKKSGKRLKELTVRLKDDLDEPCVKSSRREVRIEEE